MHFMEKKQLTVIRDISSIKFYSFHPTCPRTATARLLRWVRYRQPKSVTPKHQSASGGLARPVTRTESPVRGPAPGVSHTPVPGSHTPRRQRLRSCAGCFRTSPRGSTSLRTTRRTRARQPQPPGSGHGGRGGCRRGGAAGTGLAGTEGP